MDEILNAVNAKIGDNRPDNSIRIDVTDMDVSVRIDENGASASSDDADCVIAADRETLEAMMSGDLDPTGAFMSGRPSIEGDMGAAMQLAQILA